MKKKILLITVTVMVFVVIVAASATYILHRPGYVYRVYVDNKDIGTVSSLEDYSEILEEMLTLEESEAGLSLAIAQEVNAKREFQWDPAADEVEVEAALKSMVSYITVGWSIVVNGESLLWTATREQAEEVLDRVAQSYVVESASRELVSNEIMDDVEIRSEQVLPEDITDIDSAVALILQGREKIDTYVVARGDSLWSISRSANVSQADLKAANPALRESNVLHTGQTLNLVMAEPQITVRTVEKVHAYESIPYTTSYRNTSSLWYYQSKTVEKGVPGKREVTYEVEKINGVEENRQVVSSKIESQPVTRVVDQGTSRWPSAATGMFRWPLNSGRITDRFGSFQYWRGQRHQAVDIGASSGTAIYAAASGRVSTATYNSSYGNYVVIEHANGYSTLYAHASSLLVQAGQSVAKGDIIARVGSTGVSTGPHLHFEIRRNGTPVDPLQFYRP